MTDDEIAAAVTRGTTTRSDKVRVLYRDEKIALVKWPGEYDGRHFCRTWVSSWVTLYRISELTNPRGCRNGRTVWEVDRDGRITKKRLAELVERVKRLSLEGCGTNAGGRA